MFYHCKYTVSHMFTFFFTLSLCPFSLLTFERQFQLFDFLLKQKLIKQSFSFLTLQKEISRFQRSAITKYFLPYTRKKTQWLDIFS
jgi:hypothetical protein